MNSDWQKRESQADVDACIQGGTKLLNDHSELRAKMESASPKAPPSTIIRKLGPHRDQLEKDLLTLAVKSAVTSGKWMLFPSDEDYGRYWRAIAEATAVGKLGPTSKAATHNMLDPVNLICVYTYDFTDAMDVRRVLEELIDLGVCTREGKPIHYKCDAYTYLDIKSGNDYKLRASLYSSKELLGNRAKPNKDGPVDRVQSRNGYLDSSWMF